VVRIPKSALAAISLYHVATAIDLSLAVPEGIVNVPAANTLAGYTEWDGVWHGEAIYASWDWSLVLNSLVVINPQRLRTNIQLEEHGSDESLPLNRARILEWLDSRPWRDTVCAAIGRRATF
jgi:hypothetical protein